MTSIKNLTVLITIALSASLPNNAIQIKYRTTFNEVYVPPIRSSITGANTRIKVNATIAKGATSRCVNIFVSNDLGTRKLLYTENYDTNTLSKTFYYDYVEYYGYSGIVFEFEVLEDKVLTKNISIEPSFITCGKYEISESSEIVTPSPVKVLSLYQKYDYYETLKLTGFDGLYGRSFGCFDLHSYKIESLINAKYTDTSINRCGIAIRDPNGYFSSIGSTTLGLTTINLSLVKEVTGKYHLELPNDVYINPENLMMHSTYQTGYISTRRYVYLPKNCKENVKNSNMRFFLDGIGINCVYISHTFSLNGINNDFGYCQNSKYCVKRNNSIYVSGVGRVVNP